MLQVGLRILSKYWRYWTASMSKEGFRLVCVPSTIRLQQELVENGMMAKLIRCGARMHYPSCDFLLWKDGTSGN